MMFIQALADVVEDQVDAVVQAGIGAARPVPPELQIQKSDRVKQQAAAGTEWSEQGERDAGTNNSGDQEGTTTPP
jgi:hypothetical protein